MGFWEFVSKTFQSRSGVSSKRICGFMGWIVCLFICVWCTVQGIAAPIIVEMLFICSTSLLGIDSITGIWKKEVKQETTTSEPDRKERYPYYSRERE